MYFTQLEKDEVVITWSVEETFKVKVRRQELEEFIEDGQLNVEHEWFEDFLADRENPKNSFSVNSREIESVEGILTT